MIENALTVDVEDYFQVSAFAENIHSNEWSDYPLRVEMNTRRLLDLFDTHQMKCTFFVLGWVAERIKSLITEIDLRGHEVASHGYSHELVYNQTPEKFREETAKSKDILEDIINKPIHGYRAASYSITNETLWALDILVELGFLYDSSIFPIHHDRYGIPTANIIPHRLTTDNKNTLIEFPLSTVNLFGYRMPIAGGGYFRLYPYWLTRSGLKSINRRNRPFIFYLHPWEIDPEQPRIKTSMLSQFRHYNNLDKCESRLRRLMTDFRFKTVSNVLVDHNLLSELD